MKNYYDKILFILALALLGLGVAYCFMKGGLPSGEPPAIVKQAPSGGAYQPLPTANVTGEMPVWDPSEDQYPPAGLWYYGVFTPPKIWWDPASGWSAESPRPPKAAPPPFGMHLYNMLPRLYRVQFQSYIGRPDKTATLQMQNTATKEFFTTKVNEDNPELGVKVTDFKMVLQSAPDGTVFRVAKISLLDERTGETLTLTQNEPQFLPNDRYFLLETESPLPPKEWEVTKAGETLDVGDANFSITKVDYDAPSVTVKKTEPKQDDQEHTLTPISTSKVPPSATPAPTAPAAGATPPAASP